MLYCGWYCESPGEGNQTWSGHPEDTREEVTFQLTTIKEGRVDQEKRDGESPQGREHSMEPYEAGTGKKAGVH